MTRWIAGRSYDLSFFILATAASFLILGFHWWVGSVLGVALERETGIYSYAVFTALFDLPHIFQTFSRTFLDKTEFKRHRFQIQVSLIVLMIAGMTAAFLDYADEVLLLGSWYGAWHIMRQNIGFLKIYKLLNSDKETKLDDWLDQSLYYALLLSFSVSAFLPVVPRDWSREADIPFIALLAAFALRQAWLQAFGAGINGPKVLFTASVFSVYILLIWVLDLPMLLFVAVETIYHNVQYLAWIRLYQKKTFSTETSNAWFLATTAASVVVSAGLLLIHHDFGAADWRVSKWVFDAAYMPVFMLIIHHYYIDGIIWRMRDAPELRALVFDGK